MKKEFVKRIICILLCIIIVNNDISFLSAKADELDIPVENEIEMPYEYVWRATCYLSISGGNATASANVYGESGTTYTSVTVYLEKLVNGSWQPYTSWSHSSGIDLISSDSTTVTHGAYRVWMYVTAIGSDGSESFNVDGNVAGY